jgi:NADH-quinone oxidoreductase subunit G
VPTLTIDEKEITVEDGVTVLKAAERLGIAIPYYCYHPDLCVSGNCRMCLVEIKGSPKLAISCATPVAQGMVVFTNTERVRKVRRGILELLLISHPIDCPICDQAGECYLQNHYMDYGLHKSRFDLEDKVRKHKVIDLGSRIMLDTERCVLCSRCIRFFQEVLGSKQMEFIQRGAHSEISTFQFKPLDNPYAGNLADVCPVGALTSKDFRFKCRVWYLKGTPSVCCGCSTGCNIRIDSKDNTVYRFVPRRNPDVNKSWICDYGRLLYKDLQSPERCLVPTMRVNGQQKEIGWDDAVQEVVRRVNELRIKYGPTAVAGLGSSRATNEDLYLFKKLILGTFGSPNIDFRLDDSYKDVGAKEDEILLKKDKSPNTQGALDLGIVPQPLGLDATKILQTALVEKIKVLWILEEDVLSRFGGEDWVSKALGKVDLIVLQTSRKNPTSSLAHIVFPTPLFSEIEGTVTNFQRRVQRLRQTVAPPPQVKPNREIFASLIRAFGGSVEAVEPKDIFKRISEEVPEYRNITYEGIGESGCKIG